MFADADGVRVLEEDGTSWPLGAPAGIIATINVLGNEIPEGWAVCDGTNGTPDIRSKNYKGAGYAIAHIMKLPVDVKPSGALPSEPVE